MLNRLKALTLLLECTGDDIWSIEHCRLRGVPDSWVQELGDCFESGFESDMQTIYYQGELTNQYEGIRDVDLAIKLGEHLGIDVLAIQGMYASRAGIVRAIQEAAEEE